MTTFEIVEKALEWIIVPLLAALLGGWLVSRKASRNLDRREFFDRLNVSLNILEDGKLRIRTLLEKPCNSIFLNTAMTKMVIRAAKDTTAKDCLLPLDKADDHWYCLNSVLNEISETFAHGFVKLDLNASTDSETYVLCLTSEAADNIKTRKVRAMLIKKSVLLNFPAEDPEVEFPSHTTRITTLRQIAADYQSGKRPECFMDIELAV